MKIKIFTEAGYSYGLGHLIRCIRLKKILEKYCPDTKLYYQGDDSLNTDAQYLQWLDEDIFGSFISNTDIVVIDSYKAHLKIYEQASKVAKLLIVLDDTNRLIYPTDRILINGALGGENLYPKTKSNLTGIKYAIVDERFFANKKAEKNISNILITFGGSDTSDMIKETLNLLKDKNCQKHIILPKNSTTPRYCESENFYCNIPSSQMATLMKKCDIAISAGGGTLNELGMSQVPTLIIPIAQNQIFQSEQWHKSGSMKISSLKTLREDFDTITPMQVRQKMIENSSNIEFGSLLSEELGSIIREMMK